VERKKAAPPPGARIISVGGGKGGVGKSLVATNLAVTIARSGKEVVLCDLDLGAANLHLMLGLTRPKPGISLLLGRGGDMDEALTDTKVPGLRLLAGSGGTIAAANVSHVEKLRIIRKLRGLEADVVIIDVGAGVGYNALDFFELGQQRLVVASPQVTSVHDAYAFLKGAVLRTLRHHADRSTQLHLLEPALVSKEGEKVSAMLARIQELDPGFGEKVQRILGTYGANLVGNQLEEPGQIRVFQSVCRMVRDYLGITIPILGCIRADTRLAESVNARQPFMVNPGPADRSQSRAFESIAEALLVGDLAPEEELLIELIEEGVKAKQESQTPVDVEDLPVPVSKPRIYVRPPRKRKPEPEEKKRKRAIDAQGSRRRKVTLPGMPPSR
jgi:flagellar biosynthesis protein FlhG